MQQIDKTFDTGLRILEILRMLLDNDLSKNELMHYLNLNPDIECINSTEAFIKYFNTFNLVGLKTLKHREKYGFKTALVGMKLTKREKEFFLDLIKSIPTLDDPPKELILKRVLMRIQKYFGVDFHAQFDEYCEEKNILYNIEDINIFLQRMQNMIDAEEPVILTYRKTNNAEAVLKVELKEVIKKKNKYIVHCFDIDRETNRRINVDTILSLKTVEHVTIENINNVIFEIFGRFASSYMLRADENVIDFRNNYIVVSNRTRKRDILYQRLLKYGKNCRILTPKYAKTEFDDFIDYSMRKLEETLCTD
jgi:predicted DNA-binding transcriptional regulator YafY